MRRRTFLAGLGAMSLLPRLARAEEGGPYLVLYWAAGGWDQSFVFDPHFESGSIDRDPDAQEASSGALSWASNRERPTVDSFFGEHAEHAAIVNGIAVGSISHAKCTQLILTGGRTEDLADFPTRLAAQVAPELAMPAVLLSGPRFPGTDGGSAVAFGADLYGILDGSLPAGAGYNPDQEAVLQAWLAREAERVDLGAHSDAYVEGLARYTQLGEDIGSLELAEEPLFRDEVNTGVAALSGGLARAMVVKGRNPVLFSWDTHTSNHHQQGPNFEQAFDELAYILDRLDQTPAPDGGMLSEHTLVVAMSEMGRTPVLNSSDGKDHWPYASALFVGRGVNAGVFGATDQALAGQPIDLASGAASSAGEILTPTHLIGGLEQLFGLEPSTTPFTAPFSS